MKWHRLRFYFWGFLLSLVAFLVPNGLRAQIFVGKGATLVVAEDAVITEKATDTVKSRKNTGIIYVLGEAKIHVAEETSSNARLVYTDAPENKKNPAKKEEKKVFAAIKKNPSRQPKTGNITSHRFWRTQTGTDHIAEGPSSQFSPAPVSFASGLFPPPPEYSLPPETTTARATGKTTDFSEIWHIHGFSIRPPPSLFQFPLI